MNDQPRNPAGTPHGGEFTHKAQQSVDVDLGGGVDTTSFDHTMAEYVEAGVPESAAQQWRDSFFTPAEAAEWRTVTEDAEEASFLAVEHTTPAAAVIHREIRSLNEQHRQRFSELRQIQQKKMMAETERTNLESRIRRGLHPMFDPKVRRLKNVEKDLVSDVTRTNREIAAIVQKIASAQDRYRRAADATHG